MTWPQSFCPQCKTKYYGWAFGNPRCHICSMCGAKLVVEEGSGSVFTNLHNTEEDNSRLGADFSDLKL